LILIKLGGDMKSDIARPGPIIFPIIFHWPHNLSDDLDEILSLADRIAVIYEGEIMGVVKRNEVSIEELGLLMGAEHRHNTS
jgi:hypothetical protein